MIVISVGSEKAVDLQLAALIEQTYEASVSWLVETFY